jgi:hypothetical protein
MDIYTVREAKPEEQRELTRLCVRATMSAFFRTATSIAMRRAGRQSSFTPRLRSRFAAFASRFLRRLCTAANQLYPDFDLAQVLDRSL